MEKSYRFKFNAGQNAETRWFTDTIFTIHDKDKTIDVSDGDYDSSAGDLDEWVYVDYDTIPQVNALFRKKYGEQVRARESICNVSLNSGSQSITRLQKHFILRVWTE